MQLGCLMGNDAVVPQGAADLPITGLSADSRQVRPGFLFAAMAGVNVDGARFAEAAVAAGAVAVLTGDKTRLDIAVPVVRAANPRRALARAAARFFGTQPATIAAVTGTSGKTSVSVFLRQIWAQAGWAAASVGTIGVVTPKGEVYSGLTTPDPVGLAALMQDLAADGVTHAAIEASSHGLDQYRLDGLNIAAGAFLNLGRDHMDYHPTVDDYFRAKMRLFQDLLAPGDVAIIDADDAWAEKAMEVAKQRGLNIVTVGKKGQHIRLLSAQPQGDRQRLALSVEGRDMAVDLPLIGTFQVSNALAAAGLAMQTGVAAEVAIAALSSLRGAKGRLDRAGEINGAVAFVDYAHKPDAVANALQALRPFADGRLIVVLGAGGDRDRGKRPLMGQAAAENADIVIVTDDNPRSEDPAVIRAAVMTGAPSAREIGDRGTAIHAALAMAAPGDVVLIAGKGHEPGQIVGDKVLPFSDHDAIARSIAAIDDERSAP